MNNESLQKEKRMKKSSWIPKGHPVSWLMLMIGMLSMLLVSIDRQILPTVLPAIMKEFHMNSAQAGLITSLNFVGTFIGAGIVGLIADNIGRGHKRVLTWSISCILATISGLATFFTTSLFSLKFWRVAMGLGTGAMEPSDVALVSDFWQKEDRGFALGVNHTGNPIGQFVGPVLLAFVLSFGTWRDTFLWIPMLGIIMILFQAFVGTGKNEVRVRNWIEKEELTLPYVEEENKKVEGKSIFTNAINSLKNKNIILAIVMDFLFLWTEMGISTFLTLRLTNHLGISLAVAAVISGASGITGWIGQIVWGTVSDHIGRKFSLSIITLGFAISALGCIFINSVLIGWVVLVLWGVFRNSPYSVINSLTVDSTPETAASSLGLLVGIGYGLSGALVSPVVGWIIDNYGWTWNYIFLACSCLLVFIPLFFVKETAGKFASAK